MHERITLPCGVLLYFLLQGLKVTRALQAEECQTATLLYQTDLRTSKRCVFARATAHDPCLSHDVRVCATPVSVPVVEAVVNLPPFEVTGK